MSSADGSSQSVPRVTSIVTSSMPLSRRKLFLTTESLAFTRPACYKLSRYTSSIRPDMSLPPAGASEDQSSHARLYLPFSAFAIVLPPWTLLRSVPSSSSR